MSFESNSQYLNSYQASNPFDYPWAQRHSRIPTLHMGMEANPSDVTAYPEGSPLARLADNADDSIVRITTLRQRDGQQNVSRGSGFFVKPDGTLATAYHVVKDNDGLWVETKNGMTYRAVISQADRATDTATLRLTNTTGYENFAYLPLSQRQQFFVGEPTIALSHPHGWNNIFMSVGNLQAERKMHQISVAGGLMPGEDPNRSLLESRIHVEQGSSGGPILDQYGEVIGIIDMTKDRQGQVPAIAESNPVRDLQRLLNQNRYEPKPSTMAYDWRWLPNAHDRSWQQLLKACAWLI